MEWSLKYYNYQEGGSIEAGVNRIFNKLPASNNSVTSPLTQRAGCQRQAGEGSKSEAFPSCPA